MPHVVLARLLSACHDRHARRGGDHRRIIGGFAGEWIADRIPRHISPAHARSIGSEQRIPIADRCSIVSVGKVRVGEALRRIQLRYAHGEFQSERDRVAGQQLARQCDAQNRFVKRVGEGWAIQLVRAGCRARDCTYAVQRELTGRMRGRDIEDDLGHTDAEGIGHGDALHGLEPVRRIIESDREIVTWSFGRGRNDRVRGQPHPDQPRQPNRHEQTKSHGFPHRKAIVYRMRLGYNPFTIIHHCAAPHSAAGWAIRWPLCSALSTQHSALC